MPFPLMAVASALAAGGSLVPHAAGGMIVTGAGGYVAGTYLSTTAIAGLLGAATATVSGTALAVVGAVKSGVLGGAAAASAAAGATGANGALMSVGMLSASKIAAPLLAGGAVLIAGYYGYRVLKLTGKANAAPGGQEAHFTESEARLVEGMIKRLPRDK